MNMEALIVIGLFTIILGVILFGLSRLWMKYGLREHPAAGVKIKMTRWGAIWLCTGLIVLFAGFLAQYLAPQSLIGQFVQTPGGRLLWTVLVVLVSWLLEVLLKSIGIPLIARNNKEDEDKEA